VAAVAVGVLGVAAGAVVAGLAAAAVRAGETAAGVKLRRRINAFEDRKADISVPRDSVRDIPAIHP
jgi:hypothetical protein